MDHEWVLTQIRYMYMWTPRIVLILTAVCCGVLAWFKFKNKDKKFPELVAVIYGLLTVLIFWLYFVTRI